MLQWLHATWPTTAAWRLKPRQLEAEDNLSCTRSTYVDCMRIGHSSSRVHRVRATQANVQGPALHAPRCHVAGSQCRPRAHGAPPQSRFRPRFFAAAAFALAASMVFGFLPAAAAASAAAAPAVSAAPLLTAFAPPLAVSGMSLRCQDCSVFQALDRHQVTTPRT